MTLGAPPRLGKGATMSSKYGQGDVNPSTEQWAAADTETVQFSGQYPQQPQQQYAPQQYPPQQYGPAYGQGQYPYDEENRRNWTPWLIAIIGVLLAAIVGVLAYLFGSGAFSGSSEPVTITDVETQTLQQEAPAQQQAEEPAPAAPAPARHTYSHYAADTGVTTGPFAANVYSEFVDAYNSSGSTNVTISAYSPRTGYTYTMSCSGGSTVYCSGGNNARVRIW